VQQPRRKPYFAKIVFSAEENAEYKIHGESTRCKISLP